MINIRSLGYNWANLTQDCLDFIANCPSCPVGTMQKVPSITTKQILEDAPRARYQIDTVQLAEDLQTTHLKYLITIEDHFSKYLWAKSSSDKSANSVHLALKMFFSFSGEPRVLQCDNGKEFKNTIVETYLKKLGIEFRHGQPYHPQSQGLIERSNRTIQTALARIYHQQKDCFNLESSLFDILTEYNNNIHSSTKVAPNIAFKLNPNNMKKAFKNKINKNNFQVNQKVLIYNAVTKSKDQYLRKSNTKKKIVKGYLIPGIILKVESSHVSVKISREFTIVNGFVKENEEYKITLNLIQKVNDQRWKASFKKVDQNKFD